VPKSIAIFGAGPGLGQAVARRYADDGYQVVLVARRREPLERLARGLSAVGSTAHAIPADLSDTDGVPAVAAQIRASVGDLDALYHGPTAGGGRPAIGLTPPDVRAFMPLALYSLVALAREFLPPMIEQRDGAILLATGASAVRGMPNLSGPGPALAAGRNYLQSLQAELADKGIYVGRLYIGAVIKGSAWHARIEADKAAGRPNWARGPIIDPADLADLLWTMHHETKKPEAICPEGTFDPR
jgi:NADP-dependent 3-hydroxy acid dehydrogenase YdfG